MKKVIIGATIGIIAGFLGGRFSVHKEDPQHQGDDANVPDSAVNGCERFQTMYDRLREDYIRLQDQRQPSETAAVCNPVAVEVQPDLRKSEPQEITDLKPDAEGDATGTETAGSAETRPTTPVSGDAPTLQENDAVVAIPESEWNKADSNAKRRKLLDRVKLTNALQTIDAMQSVTAKDRFFHDLHGTFKGSIKFLAKDRKNGKINLVVRKPEDADPPHAKAWLVRIDVDDGKGKVARQTGGLDMLRTEGKNSNAFSARSSESSFIQMFYQTQSDELIGNFYEKDAAGQYPRSGSFTLRRTAN